MFRNSTKPLSSYGTDQRILAGSDEAGGGNRVHETRQEWSVSAVPFRLVLRLVVARLESQCGERVHRHHFFRVRVRFRLVEIDLRVECGFAESDDEPGRRRNTARELACR